MQLHYVLSSNELAKVREPLLTLQLQASEVEAAGPARATGGTHAVELNLEQLDAVLGVLSQAGDALRALPAPTEAA